MTSNRKPEAHTPSAAHAMDDAAMERIMGRLLQAGVLLAAAVVTAGGAMYLVARHAAHPDYRVFAAKPVQLRHPSTLWQGILHGHPSAIIDLGILLLVATPICRVLFAVIAFSVERDRLYVAISLTVLAVLIFGMLRTS